jgi:hypothetical protein
MSIRTTIAIAVLVILCSSISPGRTPAEGGSTGTPLPFDMTGEWELKFERQGFERQVPSFPPIPCTYKVHISKVQAGPGSPFQYSYPPTTDPNQLKLGPITAGSYYFKGQYASDDPAITAPGTHLHTIKYPCYDTNEEVGAVVNYGVDTIFQGWTAIATVPRPAGAVSSGMMVMTEVIPSTGAIASYAGQLLPDNDGKVRRIGGSRIGDAFAAHFDMQCVSGPCR